MRVFGTVMTILILAGIFGCTIARSRIPIRRELIHGQSKLSNISASAASETLGAIVENLDISLRRKCEENGGPTAYDAFKRELLSLPDCIDFRLNIQQLESDRLHALHHQEWRTFFEEYCPEVSSVRLCFIDTIHSIMPCLKPEEQKELVIFEDFANSILQFVCRGDGRRMALFAAIGGAECVASKQEALLVCVTEALDRYPGPGARQNFSSSDLSPEECADVEKLRTCVVRVLKRCNDPRIADEASSVFGFHKLQGSCKPIPKKPTTSTTGISIPTPTPQVLMRWGDLMNKQMCEEISGRTAYETFTESAQLVLNAYGFVSNRSQLDAEISNAPRGEEQVNVFKKYCRRAPILEGLMKYAVDSMKHCLESKERNRLDIVYKIRSSMLEFGCHNEGERISTFVASGGIECLGPKGRALMNCASESFGGYNPNIFSVGAPALELKNLEVPYVRAAKFCADVDKFRYCTMETLGQCGDRTTNLNFLNTVVDLIGRKIPCRYFLEQTELATPEISNSTIAPEGFPSTEATPQTLSDLDNITGLSDIHTMRTVSNQVFIRYLTEKCRPDYTPPKYEVARVMPDHLADSISSMLDNLRLIRFEHVHVAEGDKLDIVFKKFCRNVSTVEERMQLASDSVETCSYLRDEEKMAFLHNTTSAFQEFVCHNDGERLAKFTATRGIQIWASKERFVNGCLSEYFPNHGEHTTSYVPYGMSINACQYYSRTVKYCIAELLESRRHPTPANIIESLIDYVTRAVPCTGLLNP